MKKKFFGFIALILSVFGLTTSVFAEEVANEYLIVNPSDITIQVDENNTATVEFVTTMDLMDVSIAGLENTTSGGMTNIDGRNTFVGDTNNTYKKDSTVKFSLENFRNTVVRLQVGIYAENGKIQDLSYTVLNGAFTFERSSNYTFIDQAVTYMYNQKHEGNRAVQRLGAENVLGVFVKDEGSEIIGTQIEIDFSDKKDLSEDELTNYLLTKIEEIVLESQTTDERTLLPGSYDEITPEILEEIKTSGKKIKAYYYSSGSFIFDGSKITDTNFNISAGINVGGSQNKDKIEALVPDKEKALVVEFSHHGDLPTGTSARFYVGDKYEDGKFLSFYYYDEDKLTLVQQDLEVKNGSVEVPLEHCSEYVFVEQNGKVTPQEGTTSVETAETGSPSTTKSDKTNNAQTAGLNTVFYAGLTGISIVGLVLTLRKKQEN